MKWIKKDSDAEKAPRRPMSEIAGSAAGKTVRAVKSLPSGTAKKVKKEVTNFKEGFQQS